MDARLRQLIKRSKSDPQVMKELLAVALRLGLIDNTDIITLEAMGMGGMPILPYPRTVSAYSYLDRPIVLQGKETDELRYYKPNFDSALLACVTARHIFKDLINIDQNGYELDTPNRRAIDRYFKTISDLLTRIENTTTSMKPPPYFQIDNG